MILTDILEKSAQNFGNKKALAMWMGYRTVDLSFSGVYELAQKLAVFLKNHGLEKNEKILILAPNSPYWVCVWWGCMLGGYVPVPLNIQSTPVMIKKIAEQVKAKIIFKYLHFKQEPVNLRSYNIEFLPELISEIDIRHFKKTVFNENDLAELMYTSGTTGDPKGVPLTHKNLFSNVSALNSISEISPSDKFLSVLPLSHIYEQIAGFLLPFSNGCEIIYAHTPSAIAKLLKEHRITIMAAVPEFLKILMDKIEARVGFLLPLAQKFNLKAIRRMLFYPVHRKMGGRLKTIACGGAPLDTQLERKWNALGIDLLQGYGLTETSPVVSSNTFTEHCFGSVGKILPGVEVKIAPDGEILVRGPNVFQGYYKEEQKTKESFINGWFKTGDLGELDRDDFLFIRGRKKYMILGPGGQNVYPEDIEFEINKISGVKDSCVVSLEQPGKVEIHAVLLAEEGADAEKIVQQVNKNLASYQQINRWSVWPQEDFPRSATRKVKKEEVLKWLESQAKKPAFAEAPAGQETALMRLLAEVTGTDIAQIKEDSKIVPELNLDSLLRIELVSRIEEKLGAIVEEPSITPETRVSDLEELVKKQPAAKKAPELKKWPRSWWASWERNLDQALFIFPLARIFVKLRVEGAENLKNLTLPAIFMPNHISYSDSLILLMALPFSIRKRIAFAAASDVLYETYRRWAGLAELYFNAFPFPRKEEENIKFGLEQMGQLLDQNWSIAVYPEGQVSVTGQLQPLKHGAGLIAVEMDSEVVPVKIIGSADIVPYGKFLPRKRGAVTVKFGKPIKFRRSDSYIDATQKIQEAIKAL